MYTCATLYDKLTKQGIKCFILKNNLSKEESRWCIKMFKEGFMNVMIANNMVSRGFDMPSLKLVISFDVP